MEFNKVKFLFGISSHQPNKKKLCLPFFCPFLDTYIWLLAVDPIGLFMIFMRNKTKICKRTKKGMRVKSKQTGCKDDNDNDNQLNFHHFNNQKGKENNRKDKKKKSEKNESVDGKVNKKQR